MYIDRYSYIFLYVTVSFQTTPTQYNQVEEESNIIGTCIRIEAPDTSLKRKLPLALEKAHKLIKKQRLLLKKFREKIRRDSKKIALLHKTLDDMISYLPDDLKIKELSNTSYNRAMKME